VVQYLEKNPIFPFFDSHEILTTASGPVDEDFGGRPTEIIPQHFTNLIFQMTCSISIYMSYRLVNAARY